MPYPILSLPYPFAKRLRQLLNPFELQCLQAAAGYNVNTGLKPLVVSHLIKSLDFKSVVTNAPNANPAYVLYNNQNSLTIPKKGQLIISSSMLSFFYMSNDALKTLNTDNLIIGTSLIVLQHCHISNDFLKNVSKMAIIQPSQLDMRNSVNVDEDVKFSTILDIFPRITYVALRKSYSGWLRDLSNTGKKFHVVELFHNNFEEMFNFCPEELYTFTTKQYPDFYFHLCIRTDNANVTFNKAETFIHSRFQSKKNGHKKIIVKISPPVHSNEWKQQKYYYKQ
uniref:F-box domain-containing protein n=1 Tax=Panagrellus redivivus TaxID=6233 RepID=A0A7E4WDF6_PANRE